MTSRIQLAFALAVLCWTAGCSRQPADSGQKLADAQRQLEEARKKVAAAEQEIQKEKGQVPPPPPVAETKPEPPPPPPAPIEVTIPAGTPIAIRTASALSTKSHASGTAFPATLARDLVVNGTVIARKGAEVGGVVVSSDSGGRVKGRASLAIGARSIQGVGGPVELRTTRYTRVARGTVKRDVIRGGIMSGAGAAIGAIAGGGKGAAIGAGVGAGAGVGTAMATKGAPAEIPAETVIQLKTAAPVTVTLRP